jgi:hypothetical protein
LLPRLQRPRQAPRLVDRYAPPAGNLLHRIAVYRCDDRLFQGTRHKMILFRWPPVVRSAIHEGLFHVLTGAKGTPGPGEDGNLQFVATPELVPCFRKLGAKFVIECIEALRSVHSYHEDLSMTFSLDDSRLCCLLCCQVDDRQFPPRPNETRSSLGVQGHYDNAPALPTSRPSA